MESIRINAKLFGTLRSHIPGYDHDHGLEVVLTEGRTVRDLIQVLHIPDGESKLFLVRGLAQKLTYELEDGDEVNIFLPIGGG